MDCAIIHVHRKSGAGASGCCVTIRTRRNPDHIGSMIRLMYPNSMAGKAIVGCRCPAVMVNTSGRIGCDRVTGQTSGSPWVSQGNGQQGAAIAAGTFSATTVAVEMTGIALRLVDIDDDIDSAMAVTTIASPDKIGVTMAGMQIIAIAMAV